MTDDEGTELSGEDINEAMQKAFVRLPQHHYSTDTHHAHSTIYRTPTLPLTPKQQKKKKVTILVINMTMALQAKLKKPRTPRLNPGPEDIRIPRELTRTLKTRNQRPHNKGQLVQW